MRNQVDKSWQMAGGPGHWPYEAYDWLRRRLNRQIIDRLAQLGLGQNPAVVIEAGSGTGFATTLLAEHPRVKLSIALDYDEQALHEGQKTNPQLCAVVADINHLPFKKGAAQIVWNSSTIEHLPDQKHVVAEMSRITQAGGLVFVGVPYRWGPLFFQRWIPQSGLGIWLGTVYTRAEVESWLSRAHCQPIAWWRYFFWFFIGVGGRKADDL